MVIRKLTGQEVAIEPYRIWNAYVDILAREEYDDLDAVQRPAHLVFWYESEVQNGGHLQYFENRGEKHLVQTLEALKLLGANRQEGILRQACEVFFSRQRPRITSPEEFVQIAVTREYSTFDTQFYQCKPTLNDYLEDHLKLHQASFVHLV